MLGNETSANKQPSPEGVRTPQIENMLNIKGHKGHNIVEQHSCV